MHTLHANFNGGLMTPLMSGRFDTDKLRTGAERMENFIPRVYGGVFKRPGTFYLGETNNGNSVLFPFRRSLDVNYLVEVGNLEFRFWETGEGGSREGILHTWDDDYGTPTAPDWQASTSYSIGDIVYNAGAGYPYRCNTNHTSDASNFDNDIALGYWDQFNVAPDWAASTAYQVGDVVIESSAYHYCLKAHTSSASFATDSAFWYELDEDPTLKEVPVIKLPAPTLTDWREVDFKQLNDVIFFAHKDMYPQRLRRISRQKTNSSGTYDVFELIEVPFVFAPYLDLNDTRIAVQVQYTGIRNWADSWVTSTAYKTGDIIQGTGATAGYIYECLQDHTSAAADQPGVGANTATYWTQLATGYVVGDRVLAINGIYKGQIFTCHTAHGGATADAVDEPGVGSAWATYWNLGTSSVTVAAWATNTNYVAGNKVKQGNVIYEAKASHRSSTPVTGLYGRSGGNQPGLGQYWTTFWKISSAGTDLSGLEFNLVATEDLFTSDDVGTNWLLELGTTGRYADYNLASAGTGEFGPNESLFIQGTYLVTTTWGTGTAMIGSLYIEESLDGVTWSKIKDWNITAANDGNISYEGEAPDVGAWYRIGGSKTSGGSGGNFRIEAVSSVIKLPFLIESYTSATVVGGKLITVNDQLPPAAAIGVSTTNYRKPAFSPTEGYPRAVCFHDGRIWYGGTIGKGSRIWGSKLDDFYNFLTGSQDDSGLDLTLGATEANEIQWIASHNRAMVVGTSGQEWTIDGGDAETVITPTKARARLRTRHGSSGARPQVIAEALLWVTKSGNQLREFAYSFQIDGFNAPDMTKLISHVPGEIVQMAYQSTPDPTIWAINDVGDLYSFAYSREDNVTAWSKHTMPVTDEFGNRDKIISIATCYGGTMSKADQLWMVTKRWIDSVEVYRIERFDPATLDWIYETEETSTANLIFADMASIAGNLTQTGADVTGINYTLYADRNDVIVWWPAVNVVSPVGSVDSTGDLLIEDFTLPTGSPGTAFIGLQFSATLKAFPLDAMLQDGTGQGRKWRVNRCQMLLNRSVGGSYSDTDDGPFYDIEYPSTGIYSGRTDHHIASDWADTTQFTIKHDDPQPFGLLGYVLKGEVSGS